MFWWFLSQKCRALSTVQVHYTEYFKIQTGSSALKGKILLQTESRVGKTHWKTSSSQASHSDVVISKPIKPHNTNTHKKLIKQNKPLWNCLKHKHKHMLLGGHVLNVSYFDLIGRLIVPMRTESSTQFEETFHGCTWLSNTSVYSWPLYSSSVLEHDSPCSITTARKPCVTYTCQSLITWHFSGRSLEFGSDF